jgi:transcriptional regulator with XRE-family HTH domain
VVGKALRELLDRAGKTSADVERRLDCSQAKVSRILNGRVGIRLAELESILGLCEATDAERDAILEKWHEAKVPSQTVSSLADIPPKLRALVRLQSEADALSYLQMLLVPGPLQTDEYAEAIAAADKFVESAAVPDVVAVRRRRNALLLRSGPPVIKAVITEGVLRDVIGNPAVMRRQLEHLVRLNDRDDVDVRVRLHSAGALGTMAGAVTILEFADPEDMPSVYLEHPAGGEWIEDPESVRRFMAVFDDATRTSLSASATFEWISARIAELRNL